MPQDIPKFRWNETNIVAMCDTGVDVSGRGE